MQQEEHTATTEQLEEPSSVETRADNLALAAELVAQAKLML